MAVISTSASHLNGRRAQQPHRPPPILEFWSVLYVMEVLQEQDIDLRLPEEAVPIEGTREEQEEEVGHSFHVSGKIEEEDDDSSEEWVRDQHELDCPLCRALLFDPITTSCGHNFCRSCIVRYVHLPSSAPSFFHQFFF